MEQRHPRLPDCPTFRELGYDRIGGVFRGLALPAATVSDVESSLESTATDLGTAGADDSYGYGLVNVLAAYNLLASGGNQPPVANDDT